jgi:hypothetical protein
MSWGAYSDSAAGLGFRGDGDGEKTMLSSVEVLRGSLGGLHVYGMEEQEEEEDFFFEEKAVGGNADADADAADVGLKLIKEARKLASTNSIEDLKRETAWAEQAIINRMEYLSACGRG